MAVVTEAPGQGNEGGIVSREAEETREQAENNGPRFDRWGNGLPFFLGLTVS